MENKQPPAYIERWLEAMELERQHQKKIAVTELTEEVVHDRKKRGYCWYPAQAENTGYTIGELPFIEVSRGEKNAGRDHFQSGQPIRIFRLKQGVITHETEGVIHYIHKGKIKLILHEEDLPGWLHTGNLGVDQLHDEKTFDQMRSAMEKLLDLKGNHPAKSMVWTLYGDKKPTELKISEMACHTADLNYSQREAVAAAINTEDLAVIHGPPGTGKTTTLKHLILNLVDEGKKTLVCAPSNAATDWIATLLFEAGVKVVRMGHLSRIDKGVLDCSLESLVFSKQEAKQIKKIRLRAEECKKQAGKFKRSFGPEQRRERQNLYSEARELRNWAIELENRLIGEVLEKAEVVCSTLSGADNFWLREIFFDYCVIDEAAQALQGACWIAMLKAKKVVLAGDPWQLPPTVKSREAEKHGLGITLLDLALEKLPKLHLLDTQYRMNQSIMGFSNEWFYRGKLKADQTVAHHRLEGDEKNAETLEFIDTAGCGFHERQNPETKSFYNKDEYLIIREHMDPLLHRVFLQAPDTGIVSPYSAQIQFILEEMEEEEAIFPLSVATIDSFQGQERDIIYISLVRSNEKNQIGFLKDHRRMNVAMTRARKKLVIVGDSATISSDPFYDKLLQYIEKNGTYRTAWEYM